MLSPGKYHLKVPREKRQNLAFRLEILRQCRVDPKFRKAVLHMCKTDFIFWVDVFVWQYNPKFHGIDSVGPFITWDFQRAAVLDGPESAAGVGILWCIEHNQDLVIEKSREMGASWLCLLLAVWMFLFHPWTAVLCISRSSDAVEKTGDHKSLFWKIDFVLQHLPKWMLGGYDAESDEYKQKMLRRHPNGATITGEASTGRAGVGGRATWMLIDEFSQIVEAREVFRRTAATASSRIFSGTHKGMSTVFYEICNPASVAGSVMRKRIMHWSEHPYKNRGLYRWSIKSHQVEILDKTYQFGDYKFVTDGKPAGGPFPGLRSPWYDHEIARVGDDTGVAEDLDINPAGTIAEVFDAVRINWLIEHVCRPPDWWGDVDFSGETPVLRPETGGPLKLWGPLLPDRNTLRPGPFVLGWDLSEGVGATPTCGCGLNYTTGEKLLEYTNGKIPPEDAARVAVALAKMLHDPENDEQGAWLIWEMQGPGNKFGKTVIELGWRRMYYRIEEQKLAPLSKDDVPGWYPSPDLKDQLIRDYREGLYTRRCVNYSEAALRECFHFEVDRSGHYKHGHVLNPKTPHHAELNHGDHLTADGLAWKMALRLKRLTVVKALTPKPQEVVAGTFGWRRQMRLDKVRGRQWDE